MPRKDNNTKSKIIATAWKLFYEQGYEDTTIDDIVFESNTSKGSFYHYFGSKDELMGSLPTLFDDKYKELAEKIDPDANRFEVLIWLNQELFRMIENTVSIDMLARMYSAQLVTKMDKQLLDRNRFYFKLLRKIVAEGIERKEISDIDSNNDIVKAYALCERALLYDWCICNGDYSLSDYTAKMFPRLLLCYKGLI